MPKWVRTIYLLVVKHGWQVDDLGVFSFFGPTGRPKLIFYPKQSIPPYNCIYRCSLEHFINEKIAHKHGDLDANPHDCYEEKSVANH